MRAMIKPIALLLCAVLALPMAAAPVLAGTGESIVSETELDAAIAERVESEEAARERVRDLFQNETVREMVTAMGYDVKQADQGVDALDVDELASIQQTVDQLEAGLSGGDRTISISLVTALLIVIIIILIA